MHPHDFILLISGTNRPGSSTLRVASRIEEFYRQSGLRCELLNLEYLPAGIFTPLAYARKPADFLPLQEKVLDAAGLHIVLPEYNGSFPGVLKYFIDLLKFPESFERKPAAFVGVTSGTWGALRAVEQLQMVFGYRQAHLYPERVFISDVHNKYPPDGSIADKAIDERLLKQIVGFGEFCGLFKGR